MHLVEVILQAPSSDLPWGRQAGCSSGTVRHLRTQIITVPCLDSFPLVFTSLSSKMVSQQDPFCTPHHLFFHKEKYI